MATHVAEIKWAAKESPEEFLKGRFSRAHIVSFDGGTEVPASASPHVVGKWAVEAAVDPEEMLVASLSSCHMLSFLHLARLAGFVVRTYDDPAEGTTAENRAGATGDDQGEASPENRVGGRRAFQGDARSPASPGPRNMLHRQFGEDAGYRGVGWLGLRVHGARTRPAMARSKPGSPAVALCFRVRWAAVLPRSRFRQPRLCVTPDTEPNLDRPSRGASLPKSRARASPRRFRLR